MVAEEQEDKHVAVLISEADSQIKQEETRAEPPSKDIEPDSQTGPDFSQADELKPDKPEEPAPSTEQKDSTAFSAIEQFGEETSRQILEMGINAEKELQSAKVSSSTTESEIAETVKEEAVLVEEKENDETESLQQTDMDVLGNGLLIKKVTTLLLHVLHE
jgi:hypothetical protein